MKRVVVLLGLLMIVSCSQTPVTPLDTKPRWVMSPERPGYISVVGFAPRQQDGADDAQYKVAMMKARQELAQMVRVRVQNTLQQTVREANGAVTTQGGSVTTLSSTAALRLDRAEVNAQWKDPTDGSLYILLELPEGAPK